MSKILDIADRKVQDSLDRLLESLDQDFQAMLSKHSAEGMIRSGNTIRQAMNIVTDGSDLLKDILIDHSRWVIKQSIYVPKSISADLTNLCETHFKEFIKKTEKYIRRSTEISGQPKLFSQMHAQVNKSIERSVSEVKLEIEALAIENRSSGIKGGAKYLLSLFSKLLGG